MQKKSSGSRRWRRRRGGDGGGGSGRGQREAIRTRRVSRADAERDARILESRERTPQNAFLSSALAEAQREETTKSIFHVLRTQLEANVKKSDLWTFALAVVLQHPTLTSEERKVRESFLLIVLRRRLRPLRIFRSHRFFRIVSVDRTHRACCSDEHQRCDVETSGRIRRGCAQRRRGEKLHSAVQTASLSLSKRKRQDVESRTRRRTRTDRSMVTRTRS